MGRPVRHLQQVADGPPPAGTDALTVLEDVCDALESGSGLPEIVRAAARAVDASLVVIDGSSSVLAVAARSPGDERSLLARASGVDVLDLHAGGEHVGQLRLRPRSEGPAPSVLHVVRALIAAELSRVRGPERASAEAATSFVRAVLRRELTDRGELVVRGKELGIDVTAGASIVVARAHQRAPADDDWRVRMLGVADRGARSVAPAALVARMEAGAGATAPVARDEVVLLVPGHEDAIGRRVAAAVVRELEAGLPGFAFTVGRSRPALDPVDLPRAGNEALLAANVAEAGGPRSVLAFEETGAYRLLLATMSEDPEELRRFYAETLETLVAYDEQYETDLVQTLDTFLEADGNVAGTAAKLFTHRHTVRYRLEQVRELTGLDIGSSDGREKLSLGLKAMRVLGIPAPGGPATERGAEAGRVPREDKDRR